jgi:Na+-transporting NADH:ubiquinone oxidoreductase subunit E
MAPQIHWLLVMFAAIFTNNILLAYFLGMCSFLAVSKTLKTAYGLGLAVTFVTTTTAILNYGIYYLLLNPETSVIGVDLTFLQYIIFIAVIAAFVQLVEMVIDKYSPTLYNALGIFLPLITVNCAILGTSVFMVIRNYTFIQAAGYGIGSGVGWLVAIVLIAGIRQQLRFANIPEPLKGVGITMIMTGLMAMAFLGFAGVANLG